MTTGPCGRETASETAVPATRESRETRAARVRERCVRRPRPGAGPWACGRRGRGREPQAQPPSLHSQVLDTLVSCIRVAPDTHKKVM